MTNITFTGVLPSRLREALPELLPLLGLAQGPGGLRLDGYAAPGPEVRRQGDTVRVGWGKPVHFYRALSLLAEGLDRPELTLTERPCFETGFMIDASRNAVPCVDGLKRVLRRMALMGMDTGMMYTEDTYEVPEYPYFGYMRGRYTQAELRELDDYADVLGIELIPFIQTLGHLNRILHWPDMYRYADNGEVLLADSEDTYALIRAMLRAASAPYRTRRIHIGMDETHGIGMGAHLGRFGYETPHAIIKRHLRRVKELCDELGLRPMMWGDMFFRPDSPTGGYYDTGDPSPASLEARVPGVEIVYWDYYHNTEAEYAANIEKHRKLCDPPLFAGGIWTWTGPAPDYEKTVTASVAGLRAAKAAGLPFCIGCAWGDNGAEANILTALFGMQLYAEFAYAGEYDPERLQRRFQVCCGAEAAWFTGLSGFNTVPGMVPTALRPVNAAKFLLYEDPMVQLFEADTRGLAMADHYAALEEQYAAWAAAGEGGEYAPMLRFYALLAGTLAHKCRWHEGAAALARAGDRRGLLALSEELAAAREYAEKLRRAWRELWALTNKPYGFEVIDGRMGAVCARLDTARSRVEDWAAGGGETLPELLEPALPYTLREGGRLFGSYAVGEIFSACKID